MMLARVIVGPPRPDFFSSLSSDESRHGNGLVRVEIPIEILGSMLREERFHVADLHCLDYDSKQSIRKLSLDCLQSHLAGERPSLM